MAKPVKKEAPKSGMLVKASRVNLFQVIILVLLFVVAGVVYKVYSHGATINPYASLCKDSYSQSRPTIKQNSTSVNCVKAAQWDLNHLYWYGHTLSYGLVVDGNFGTKTYNAVYDFQKRFSQNGKCYAKSISTGQNSTITVDGIVGPITWRLLFLAADTDIQYYSGWNYTCNSTFPF